MKSITVSIEEDHIETLDELSQDSGPCANRSEAMRMIISQHSDAQRLAEENERLQREKRQILDQREEHNELVEYVDREKSLQERRIEAAIWERARWWLFGKSQNERAENE